MLHNVCLLATLLFCGVAIADAAGQDRAAASHRLLMQTTINGEVGETVTCYEDDGTRVCTVTFPKVDAALTITVVMAGPDGEETDTFGSNGSGDSLPMVDGHIKRLTVKFRHAGACQIEVHVREPD